jgi:hypothetical protein
MDDPTTPGNAPNIIKLFISSSSHSLVQEMRPLLETLHNLVFPVLLLTQKSDPLPSM